MAKGYLAKIDDVLDKMTRDTDAVIEVLHEVDDIVYYKRPKELTDQEIQKLQGIIIQAMTMLVAYNSKLYGTI